MSVKISELTQMTTLDEDAKIAVETTAETKYIEAGKMLAGQHGSYLVWDDLRAPATQLKQGSNTKPDFDFTDVGFAFDPNDTETLYVIFQLSHEYSEGTAIVPHLHWIQEEDADVLWQLEYKWYNVGEAEPASWTTLTSKTKSINYTSGSISQITSFGEIDGTGKEISSFLKCKMSRLGGNADDTYTGDARLDFFDVHYQKDALGSAQETSK